MIWAISLTGAALAVAVGMTPLSASHITTGGSPHIPTIADPARGLDLWRGAKVGMKLDQVRAIFPATITPPKLTTLTGGEMDQLVLLGVDLVGNPAVAHFFFKNGELISVELRLADLKAGAPVRNLQIVQRLSASLTALYGQHYDCGEKGLGDIDAYECKWLKAPLSIRLWYMDTAGQAPVFYLAFRQVDDPGYNL